MLLCKDSENLQKLHLPFYSEAFFHVIDSWQLVLSTTILQTDVTGKLRCWEQSEMQWMFLFIQDEPVHDACLMDFIL